MEYIIGVVDLRGYVFKDIFVLNRVRVSNLGGSPIPKYWLSNPLRGLKQQLWYIVG